MPEIVLQAGARFEIPNKAEVRDAFSAELDARDRQAARGFKWLRLPEILTGTPSGNAITLGATKGQVLGPESGYAWSLKRLIVSGLTTGATPDVVNLYRNDRFSGPPLWQFNGNNFGYTFGKLELVLMGGDTLSLQNVGSIASTSPVLVSGELIEVPAEMLWKLY